MSVITFWLGKFSAKYLWLFVTKKFHASIGFCWCLLAVKDRISIGWLVQNISLAESRLEQLTVELRMGSKSLWSAFRFRSKVFWRFCSWPKISSGVRLALRVFRALPSRATERSRRGRFWMWSFVFCLFLSAPKFCCLSQNSFACP